MEGVSFLGSEAFYTLLIIVVLFGINRQKGFIVAQVVLWTAIITGVLKSFFALPRPLDVDSLVVDLSRGRTHLSPFTSRGASSFFGLLPQDVIAYTRTVSNTSYGFPSGHVSSTVATWGTLCLLFRRPWLLQVTLALVLLMPLSRMYLGRHFLADVVGGLVIGLLVLLIVAVYLRTRKPEDLSVGAYTGEHGSTQKGKRVPICTWAELVFMFVLPIGALFFAQGADYNAATLLGLNAGYLLTGRLKVLDTPRTLQNRILTVFIALAVAVILGLGLGLLNSQFHLPDTRAVRLPQVIIVAALILIISGRIVKTLLLRRTRTKQT
jgi:membrane-associated phospholipid phosphatase